MGKIIIKGLARTEYDNLSKLDGINCQENFVEYADRNLKNKLEYGYMEFEYNEEENKLYVVVKYNTKEQLTSEECEELIEYTKGQLSDGIGEGFEQEPCYYDDEDNEVYISPWYYGQKLKLIQL